MKKLYILMALILVSLASGINITQFNDNTTEINMTANITKYVTIPIGSQIIEAEITLTGTNGTPLGLDYAGNINRGTERISCVGDAVDEIIVQNFTPETPYLYGIEIYSHNLVQNGNATIEINITNNAPDWTSTSYYSEDFTIEIDAAWKIHNLTFASPIELTMGTVYQYRFRLDDSNCANDWIRLVKTDEWEHNASAIPYKCACGMKVGESWAEFYSYNETFYFREYYLDSMGDVLININETTVFNNTGFLRGVNESIDLNDNNALEDYVTTNGTVPINFLAKVNGSTYVNDFFISYIDLFECTGSPSEVVAYNFTLTDEDNFTTLTGDIYVDLEYEGFILSFEEENTSSIALCIGVGQTYTIDGFLQSNIAYSNKYFLRSAVFDDTTNNINFYNRGTIGDFADMVLSIRDNSFIPFPNIIGSLERYYPANHTWLVVQQDDSDEFGQLFYNIREESVEYRLRFYRNATLIDSTNKIKFKCIDGLCQVSFQIYEEGEDQSQLVIVTGYNNETDLLDVNWSDASGGTDSVRILVQRDTMTGTVNVCDSSIASPSGSYQCNVSLYEGTFSINVYSPSTDRVPTINQYLTKAGDTIADHLAVEEYAFWSFILVLTFTGIGALSVVAAVVSVIIGILIISVLGLNPIVNVPFVIVVGVIGIAIAIRVKR